MEILSTGGTYRLLQDHKIPAIEIADYTGFTEMMDGRVKTLHPKVHGGILARREIDAQVMQAHHIPPIDLVVVNLYPFAATVAKSDCDLPTAIDNIDIGGPTMLRAAAKNNAWPEADLEALRTVFRDVTVSLLAIEQAVGNPTSTPLYTVHCPMAFDDAGADWIQVEPQVSNPYFGASMLRCGAVQRISKGH